MNYLILRAGIFKYTGSPFARELFDQAICGIRTLTKFFKTIVKTSAEHKGKWNEILKYFVVNNIEGYGFFAALFLFYASI